MAFELTARRVVCPCLIAVAGIAASLHAGAPPEPAANPAAPAAATPAATPPKSAADAREAAVLKVGDKAPDATLTTPDGKTVQLASMYKDGPVIVTFYRGGWCPFCNTALKGWETRQADVKAAGATFVAISPEKPENVAKTATQDGATFPMMSDAKLEAAKGFNVAFMLDERTQTAYKGYGVDLASSNAAKTWELPMPATFVVDKEGVIRYAFAEMDYKRRADPDQVLGAVKALNAKK